MGQPLSDPPLEKKPERRLDSWKEIAAYLNRDVTTVQRWEKREAMPIHRHLHDKRGSVYALTGELDAWVRSRRFPADETEPAPAAPSTPPNLPPAPAPRIWFAVGALLCLGLAVAAWLSFRHRPSAAALPRIRSIAVLPLRNISQDPGQEYLADGITDALIGRLSEIHDLRVTSHTSVMRFRNPQQSVPEIARALGVDAVVEGSVLARAAAFASPRSSFALPPTSTSGPSPTTASCATRSPSKAISPSSSPPKLRSRPPARSASDSPHRVPSSPKSMKAI